MDGSKLSRCIICSSYTAKRQCYNIFTTTLDKGDILLSNFLKNVLSCSVLIIVPPDFFLCKRCYTLCAELDYSLDRCNTLQKRIQSLFQVTKANQEAVQNGSEPVEVKYEPEEEEEFYHREGYEGYEEGNYEGYEEGNYEGYEEGNYEEYEDGNFEGYEEGNFEGYEKAEENQEGETVEEIQAFLDREIKQEKNDEEQEVDVVDEEQEVDVVDEEQVEVVEEEKVEVVDEERVEVVDESSQLIEDGVFWAPTTHFYEEVLPSDSANVEEVETDEQEISIIKEIPDPVTAEAPKEPPQPPDGAQQLSTQVLVAPAEKDDETPDPLGMVWFCKPCKMKFRSFESLKKHKKSTTCKSTTKKFGIQSAYEYKNYTIKLKEKKRVFFCNYCTFEAPSAEAMDKHIISHKSDPPLMCDICGRRFKTPSTFKRHLQVHDESRPFACKMCTFRSDTELTLKIHQRIHDDQKKFCCTKCNYKSTKKMSYQNHLRTHTGERPYCCPDCPYRAKDSSTLIRHRRTHGGLKRYHCSLCDYKALQKNSLKRHMMIHTGEKPHTCPHCDYSSTMRHNLADHIAAKHSTEKPYACNICSYKAKAKRLLKYHMRIHSGEKPFACTECDFRVRHRTSLSYHMRTRHPPNGVPQRVILKFVHYTGDVEFSDDEEEEYEIDLSAVTEEI